VFTARYGLGIYIQFYVLPTQLYLCVLCGSQNKQGLFPYTALTVFITETESVYCAVRTGYLYIIHANFRLESATVFSRPVCLRCDTIHVSAAARHAVHSSVSEYNKDDKISLSSKLRP